MKLRSQWIAGVLALLCMIALAGCTKLRARDELNKGVRSFRDAKYETAVDHFKKAVDLDPDLINAHLYLAAAYASQFVPGGESEENKKLGEEAIRAYETVLQKDPKNVDSVKGIAGLYLNMKQFAKAKEFYIKTAELEPTKPDPFYSVGNVNWILCYDKQNPLPWQKKSELIEEGLTNLNKALVLDPDYYYARFYINLLLRQKAQVAIDEFVDKNPKLKDQFAAAALDQKIQDALVKRYIPGKYAEYSGYLKKADENYDQAMAIKKRVEEKADMKGVVDPNK
jgi:tetratricopeptide (TPR) repeat protein